MSERLAEEAEFLQARGAALLQRAGLAGAARFHPIPGGRNNRVYRVEGVVPEAVLKWYFAHPDDSRNRLAAEYAFLEFAQACGADCVPRPLARSDPDRMAVYTYLPGERLRAGEVTAASVAQAIDLFARLNQGRDLPQAALLPRAAEACFSLEQHMECVGRRVQRLADLPGTGPEHDEARRLVQETLEPAWHETSTGIRHWAARAGLDMHQELPREQRCISPSDFGFHNAVRAPDGRLQFLDFEYAGWDDPAKLLCDFYCQPQLPAPPETWPLFAGALAPSAATRELEQQRYAILFPLYRIKWCCILLNEFLPAAEARREFAARRPVHLRRQLTLAQRLAEQLRS